LESSHADLV